MASMNYFLRISPYQILFVSQFFFKIKRKMKLFLHTILLILFQVVESSSLLMELTNILMKMIQETTDFSNAFNVTSFSSVLQRLEVMMTQQLGTKLTEWYVKTISFFSTFLEVLASVDRIFVIYSKW
jgi:hypothetical protein